MREDGGDLEASRALDVHEERVGLGHNLLELVGASLNLGGGVEKVNSENLGGLAIRSIPSQLLQVGEGLSGHAASLDRSLVHDRSCTSVFVVEVDVGSIGLRPLRMMSATRTHHAIIAVSDGGDNEGIH